MLDNEFEQPWLLICEGGGDVNFLRCLLQHHKLESRFEVKSINQGISGKSGGRQALGGYIQALSQNEKFIENVEVVLIVSDNDEDPDLSFKEVQDELKKAGLPVPGQGQSVAREQGKKATVVLMIPTDGPGNLEALCLPAAHRKWGLKQELEDWISATPARDWSVGKQAKVKLQTLIGSHNKRRPETGFAAHWACGVDLRIDVADEAFQEVVTFFHDFGDLVAVE